MEPFWQLEKYGYVSDEFDGQYEIGLLWIDEDPALPNKRVVAKK